MCGIAGVRRYGAVPITSEEIKLLLMSLERRGNHATGIAFMDNGKVFIHKAAVPAWSFVADKETVAFLDAHVDTASMVLLHTRFATIGNPSVNENNHPVFLDNTAVVHNGGINNYDFIFNDLKAKKSCATDSDIFRAILDSKGMVPEAVRYMNKLSGSAAIAAFCESDPDRLLLARSGSPLKYGVTADKLWWASEMKAIQLAVRPWEKHHGLWARKSRSDVAYYSMPDDTAYLLGPDGVTDRMEFKTCASYRAPNYQIRATYHSKMSEWRKEAPKKRDLPLALPAKSKATPTHKSANCPNGACGVACRIPFEDKFTDYKCGGCQRILTPLDSIPLKDLLLTEEPMEITK